MKKKENVSYYSRTRSKHDENSKAFMTMTLKIIACLAVFTLLTVLIVWVMQILMSDTFYENVKNREISVVVSNMKNHIESGEDKAAAHLEKYADIYDLSIGLYSISGSDMSQIHLSVQMTDSFLNEPSIKNLWNIYDMAKNKNGTYIGRFGYDLLGEDQTHYDKDIAINVVRADVFLSQANREYMILVHSKVTPVETTRKTFTAQFGYTIIFLSGISVIMAYFLSRLISRPLKNINDSAKELAAGNYNVKFNGRGYREVSELSDTLNYAASELARNDNLRKELLANVSHDLRTPLTMIKGYGEIMRDIPGENNAENIQAVIDEASRLSELVNDLLDISKLENDTGKFEEELFDITEAVSNVIERYEKVSALKEYKIFFIYDSQIKVYADRSMILQVIYNLINNAINYGGDDNEVQVKQREIIDESGRRCVRISVSDRGNGIEKNKLPLIWDRYYKVDRVHSRATVGTGLGLSIVKKVLERHNASYGVNSEVGKGSEFWFELPIFDQSKH